MKDTAFSRETRVTQVNDWLEKATAIPTGERLFEGLKRRFDKHQDSILQAVEARSRDRLKSLETTLETRKQQEIENITTVLDELERAIRQRYEGYAVRTFPVAVIFLVPESHAWRANA